LILLIFFVISFINNIIGPLIPDIIESFDLSLTLVALIPLVLFIAYAIMSIPAGILLPSYLTDLFSYFTISCGMTVLQVVINLLLRATGGEEHFAMYAVLYN